MFKKTFLPLLIPIFCLSQASYAVDPRIVGGKFAANHAYPFLVSLEYSSNGFAFCGGTLITPTKVLTAAHCADTFPIQIRAGTNNKLFNAGQVINVVNQVKHPKYNDVSLDYDVAVFTLEKPVTLSNNVNIIALPEACASLTCITGLAKPDTLLRIAGWGSTRFDGGNNSNNLREADVPVVANKTCNDAVGVVTSRMVCAGFIEGGKDACLGDSGGAIFAYLPSARAGLQAGIVSWGIGYCGQAGTYGVYTRISHPKIRAFIREQTL